MQVSRSIDIIIDRKCKKDEEQKNSIYESSCNSMQTTPAASPKTKSLKCSKPAKWISINHKPKI